MIESQHPEVGRPRGDSLGGPSGLTADDGDPFFHTPSGRVIDRDQHV